MPIESVLGKRSIVEGSGLCPRKAAVMRNRTFFCCLDRALGTAALHMLSGLRWQSRSCSN
jgi:hypothetical protein